MTLINRYLFLLLPVLFLFVGSYSFALEPEPRKWSHLPIDTNFGGVAFAHTDADIKFDPVLELEDVEMSMDTWAAKYIRSFELLGTTSRVDILQGYHEAKWTGLLKGEPASTKRYGLSDTFVRFATNLYGAPPLKMKDYAAYRATKDVETIVGVGLTVRLPVGDYSKDKLLNLGKNRYAIRPEVGFTHKNGKWITEMTGEVAFYTDNNDFYKGTKLKQKPLFITHGHLIYTFKPGLWAGASAGYDYGGRSKIDGVKKDDRKQDVAWALSMAYPINPVMGVKVVYVGSHTQEATGLDTKTFAASLSYLW